MLERFLVSRLRDAEFTLVPNESEKVITEAFYAFRDIPFGYPKTSHSSKTIEEITKGLIENCKGTCTSKHLLLGRYYENLGLDVKYVSHRFYWQDQKICFPGRVLQFAKWMPFQLHMSLMVAFQKGGDYLPIDCTWDKSLKGIGVWVNEFSLSSASCKIAVTTDSDPIIHNSYEQKLEYLNRLKQKMLQNDDTKSFYNAFDDWLVTIRSSQDFDAVR
jgi:hypothetical protein